MTDSTPAQPPQPLAGVRVVELATGVAGPYAGKLLADFGADVVKVEPPGGDRARWWGPFPGPDPAVASPGPSGVPEDGALHLHLNTNKRSVVADLACVDDRDLVFSLAARADVVLESFAPGHLEGAGVGWERLQAANPALVLTSVTPFGQSGPYATFRGGEIVAYAMGGPMQATGVAEQEPLKLGGYLIGYQCGGVAALASLAALAMAEASGRGCRVDVSNFETQAGSIDRRMVFLLQHAYNGRTVTRPSRDSRGLLPTGIYPAADGYLQIGTPPLFAPRMLATIGDPELSARFSDPTWITDPEIPDITEAAIYSWLADRTTAQATAEAQAHNWPVTSLRSPAQVVADEHLAARGFWAETDHPEAGRLRQPGPPFRLADAWGLRRAAPTLGRHDAEVRAEIGAGIGAERRAPRRRSTSMREAPEAAEPRLPLDGVRVLDLTVVWAGPYTTMLLADLGAEVIRVENPWLYNGTRGAAVRPPRDQLDALGWLNAYPDDEPGERPWNRNAFFNCHARNKLSATVDLRAADGREAFLRLVERSDVLVENNSVGVMDKLGLSWATLHARNPRLVLVRMPALGLEGPMAGYLGFGSNFEALCGLTSLRGHPGDDPSSIGPVYYMDAASGVAAASAVLLALRRRQRSGVGDLVEVPQAENMLNHIGEQLIDAARSPRADARPALGNRHLTNAPQGAYRCRGDDRWVVISVDDDEAWAGLRRAMGHPGWAEDERYDTAAGRREHHETIDTRISSWTTRFDPWEITRRCQAKGVACGPVLRDDDCFEDPHLRTRGFFRRNGSDDVGSHDYPGHLWRWTGPPLRWEETCPFGAANDHVWREVAGFSDAEYEALRAGGHISRDYLAADGNPL